MKAMRFRRPCKQLRHVVGLY